MTRAERRRAERAQAKLSNTYTMDQRALNKIKSDAASEAIDAAFILMLGLPISILIDKFGQLMPKEGRAEKFMDLLLERYELYKEGYFSLDDIIQNLREETGLTIPGVIYDSEDGMVRFDRMLLNR